MNIWVLATESEMAAELLSQAVKWGQVRVLLDGDEAAGQDMLKRGADAVSLMPLPADGPWQGYRAALWQLAEREQPELIMAGNKKRARDLAGYLAARLDIPCLAEIQSLEKQDDGWQASRLVYGGLALKTLRVKGRLMVTVAAKLYEPAAANRAASGDISALAYDPGPLKVLERQPKPAGGVDLALAQMVIGIGRGFEKPEELRLAETLAEVMGAELGCTRPISEFFGWLPEDRYIGISGRVIKPKLYLAAGISGQVQHTYGVRDAKVIVCVNKDEQAAMHRMSDYCIVGDIKEVLPAIASAWQDR